MALEHVLFPDLGTSEFVESADVALVAEQVLDRHGRAGGIREVHPVRRALIDDQVRIAYLLNTKPFDPTKDEVTHDAIAKCIKAPRLWHDVTGLDLVIWVRAYFWNLFDPRQRAGVLLHELLHVEIERIPDSDELKLKLRHHDVEEFIQAVRHYGDFIPNRQSLVKAFGLWQQDGGKPAKPQALASDDADSQERPS